MSDKGRFGIEIRQFAEKAGAGFDTVIKTTLLDLSNRVIMRTPVGQPSLWKNPPPPGYTGGHARANWQSSIGNPAEGEINAIDPNGAATLNNIRVSEAPGNVWWLTNNLPYIQRLEYDGWSTQASEGMVRVTLAELDASIMQAIADLPK